MKAAEIRKAFLDYFAERGHTVVPSASVIPQGDATLMFGNAGMVPFKRVFTGEETRPYTRATSSQKCIRVSGKHNDLEEVGRSPSHHTFFEMLGNFSFGDYFKEDAIRYGWDFLTNVLGIAPNDLVVSVHQEDDEAFNLWRDEIGLEERRIFRLDDKENFWQMGDTGPCGPCSEIHVITDRAVFEAGGDPSGDGYTEVWNLVFMQFDQAEDGTRTPLPKPCVDTGLGLERITCTLQSVTSDYETDLFTPLIAKAAELAGTQSGTRAETDVSLQVIADHARSCTILIGDGVLPSNEGRGYVLRRILRRAARHGVLLGIEGPFLHEVAAVVIDELGGAFPELMNRAANIRDTILKEEERFGKTVVRGLALLDEEIAKARQEKRSELRGDVVFKLYDTFGFPTDLTEDILRSNDLRYDRDGFDACMREQADRARAAWKGSGQSAPLEIYSAIATRSTTTFTGYDGLSDECNIVALVRDGAEVDRAGEGDRVDVIVARTPFYGESGGQVGDSGTIETPDGRVEIEDTQKPVDGLVVHHGRVALGSVNVADPARLEVDPVARASTVRNHSGTHLLHLALREVLGEQVSQAGSMVGPDRLRFDFTYDEALSRDQILEIEDRVNGLILANHPGVLEEKSYDEAVEAGAMAIFEEKYGDRVRVVAFGPSVELCGGTHANATGDIGSFRILSQSAIGAGVRRIEAQTGLGALEHARREAKTLREASELLKAPTTELPERVRRLLERQRELERELEKTRADLRRGGSADPMSQVVEVAGLKVIATEIEGANPKELRTLVDELKQRLGSGVVLLATRAGDKAAIALGVTGDLTSTHKAGDLIKAIAGIVGGSGGGRPDFAQAGGSEPDRIPEALAKLLELLA